jgi:hypothetical protein
MATTSKGQAMMLWYMPKPEKKEKEKSLEQHLTDAANYYKGKYGEQPNLAFVSSSRFKELDNAIVGGISIEIKRWVQPNDIHIGVRREE